MSTVDKTLGHREGKGTKGAAKKIAKPKTKPGDGEVEKDPIELGMEYMKEALDLMTTANEYAKKVGSGGSTTGEILKPQLTKFADFMSLKRDELRVLVQDKRINTPTADVKHLQQRQALKRDHIANNR